MTIFYKNYPYAPVASILSGLIYLGGLLSAVFGLLLVLQVTKSPIKIVPGLLLIGLAVFLFAYVGRTVIDKVAEKETEKNITTKPRWAAAYVSSHPQEYEKIAQINPAFGEKYFINENGKLAKRK